METRNSWGIVYVAAIFATLAIGVALGISHFDKKAKLAHVTAVTKNFSDWQSLSSNAPTTTPPAEPAQADAISQDLYEGYNALLNKGTFTAKERDALLADVVKKNAVSQNIVPLITLVDLNIATTSVDNYLALVAVLLSQSTQVKQYELDVFANAVANEKINGIPELAKDAELYQKIAAAILVMEVPPQLAPAHLEVVKSIGALAKAVSNMSSWNGDPIDALTMTDSFNKATAYVEDSVNTLLATADKLRKKV